MVDKVGIARGAVKAIAMLVGLPATTLCLMSLVGLVTDNGWVRSIVALLVAIMLPAFIADRLLPDDAEERPKGLVSDVLAVTWMAIPVLVAVALNAFTRPALAAEGDRLRQSDMGVLAKVVYKMAAVDPEGTTTTPSVSPSASTSASSSASTSAPTPKPQVTASATTSATAPAAEEPAPKNDTDELSPAELFREWAPAVVSVGVTTKRGMGGGTGFLIDTDGTIVTNYHVIDQAEEGTIKFKNGAIYDEITVLVADPDADLALLYVDLEKPKEGDIPSDVTPAVIGDSDKIEVGERAISIGNPLGLDHTLTTGVVSARRVWRDKNWIQMSTPVSPGNSGGPVFNGRGEVIGVTTAIVGVGFAQNLNLAVPINVLKSKIKKDYPAKRKLGQTGGASSW